MSGRDIARQAAWQEHGRRHWRKYVYGPMVLRYGGPLAVAAVIVWGLARLWREHPAVMVTAVAVLVAAGVIVAARLLSWRRYR